jgi:hypothetical protein
MSPPILKFPGTGSKAGSQENWEKVKSCFHSLSALPFYAEWMKTRICVLFFKLCCSDPLDSLKMGHSFTDFPRDF